MSIPRVCLTRLSSFLTLSYKPTILTHKNSFNYLKGHGMIIGEGLAFIRDYVEEINDANQNTFT
ncbi:hypothetical protein Sarmat_01059 [Rickettsiales endosymbiont of Paramecium tredecaurelia]|nr:hypothetical protein [Candidatus Sarmatiella mevalonica]